MMREIFSTHDGLPCDKWDLYLDVYERHLSRFRETPLRLLEIGVQRGGSLQLWRKYFGDAAIIVGIDIDGGCEVLNAYLPNEHVYIGDQSNPLFLEQVVKTMGGLDVVIDDGGHMNEAQCASFLELYPRLSERGVYICEDVHTSYWSTYNGGLLDPRSFVEFSKKHVDELNADHNGLPTSFARMTDSIHYYDSMVVYERGFHPVMSRLIQGR